MPKKPTVEYYWSPVHGLPPAAPIGAPKPVIDHEVNVRIKAANGLIIGQITQGFLNKTNARRGVTALAQVFLAGVIDYHVDTQDLVDNKFIRESGPGPKPKGLP